MSNINIGGFNPESLFAKALIPILDALDWNGSNIDLIESLVDNANNMDKNGLIETLANLKFNSYVSKIKNISLDTDLYPSLYITKDNIYVLIGIKDNKYLVYDTSISEYKDVKYLGTGKKVIIFSPLDSTDFNLLKPQKSWFFHLINRFKKEFSYVVLISLLLTLTSFITPLFIMLIHSQVKVALRWQDIAYLGIAAFVFIFGSAGLKYLRSYLLTYLSGRIGNLVSKEIYRRLLYLPPKYIETSSVTSQLNRIKDFESITDFFSSSALTSLIDIPLSILMIIGLIFIGGNIVFVPMSAYLIMIVVGFVSYYSYRKINNRDVASINEKNRTQNEMLSKMSEIRISGNKERWFTKFKKYYSTSIYNTYNSSKFLLIVNSASHSIVNITLIISISVSVFKVIHGDMSSAALFSSFIIISRILAPLRGGFSTISQLSKLKKSINQLNKFMSIQIEDRPASITTIQDQVDGDIRFNNVFLKYGQEISPALINIKFILKQSQTTVITGHGGCGKSSIIKVILGLYTPLSGTVTIDNINIMQLDRIQLRKSIAYLPADPYLFPGSIKFNLYLAKPDATIRQIETVLDKVGIKESIYSLDKGIDTDVQDLPASYRKDKFIKRINLAMMLIRDFPIYVIDSLEKGLEVSDYDFFYKIIKELKGVSTVILTTNRPKFIRLADKLVTMDSGRIQKIEILKEESKNEQTL